MAERKAKSVPKEPTPPSPKTIRKRLEALGRLIPDDADVRGVMIALQPQHNAFADHAIALIGAELVSKALEVAICGHLVPLEKEERERLFNYESRGPLSDLSGRIKMAYAMSIVGPKTRDDLEHIRTIRNQFAHALHVLRFDMEEVADVCSALTTPEDITLLSRALLGSEDYNSPRSRYIETTLSLASRLKGNRGPRKRVMLTPHGALVMRDLP